MGATENQIRAAFAAAKVESNFANLNGGDRDSVGVFQQRPSQGWGSVAQILDVGYAAGKFFEAVKKVSQSGTIGQIAQRVQRSAFPNRYDEQLSIADELYTRLTDGGVSNVTNAAGDSNAVATATPNSSNTFLVLGAIVVVGVLWYRS